MLKNVIAYAEICSICEYVQIFAYVAKFPHM